MAKILKASENGTREDVVETLRHFGWEHAAVEFEISMPEGLYSFGHKCGRLNCDPDYDESAADLKFGRPWVYRLRQSGDPDNQPLYYDWRGNGWEPSESEQKVIENARRMREAVTHDSCDAQPE